MNAATCLKKRHGSELYQSRKEEAIHRLETTERNLERALDIIAEINRECAVLKNKPRKVGEYKTVQDALSRACVKVWITLFKALKEVNQTSCYT
jgi:chromosome segregation ATPase